jgi:TonB family protein
VKKILMILAVLGVSAAPAFAAGKLIGPSDCRAMSFDMDKPGKVTWSGACKDGFADGPGELVWSIGNGIPGKFKGTLNRGQAEGPGYLEDSNGDQYDGNFQAGLYEGAGIKLKLDGDEYNGEWKAGEAHGQGMRVYATGGRYDGQWVAGERHGKGKATLRDGTVVEGEFRNGLLVQAGSSRVDQPPPAHLRKQNASYLFVYDGDAMPAPLGGSGSLTGMIMPVQHRMLTAGRVALSILVDSEGKTKSVSVLSTTDPKLSQAAARAVSDARFEPGRCQGKPCEMPYIPSFIFNMQ